MLAYSLRVKGSNTMSFVSSVTERKIENGNAPEIPPPGLPFVIAILAEPMLVMRLAAMVAESCVLFEKVVGRGAPFQLTVAPSAKLEPLTFKIKAPLPSTAV